MPGLYGQSGNVTVNSSNTTGLYAIANTGNIITGNVSSVNTTGLYTSGGNVYVPSSAQQLLNLLSNNGTVIFQLDPAYAYQRVEAFATGNGGGGTGNTIVNLVGEVTGLGATGSAIYTTLSNTGVVAATYGNLTYIPQIKIAANGRVTAASVVIGYGNANVASYLTNTNITVAGLTTTGNVSAGNVVVTTGIFYANGQPFVSSSYGNANVAAYLNTYQSNIGATRTGNISTGNVYANNGNFTGNVRAGNLIITGNTYFSNVNATITTTLLANANVVSTNTTTGTIVSYGGVGIVGDLNVGGNITANLGTLAVGGNITSNSNVLVQGIYTNNYFYANGQPLSTSFYSNANVTAYLASNTDPTINAIYANVGTLYLGNIAINANLGAFETYANLTFATNSNVQTLSANVGAFETYANTQINTINANLGAYQTYANANAASQATSINTINANVGAFQTYANTQIGTINANLGAFETYANTQIGTINANLGVDRIWLGNLQANVYTDSNVQSYLPSYISPGTAGTAGFIEIGSYNSGTAIAIGKNTGWQSGAFPHQSSNSIAIGPYDTRPRMGAYAITIGHNAGWLSGTTAIAIGEKAAGGGGDGSGGTWTGQSAGAIAIGPNAGWNAQGLNAVALGSGAGYNGQGQYAVAIGAGAGYPNQPANSIVINANVNTLTGSNEGLYISPVRNDTGNITYGIYYNTTTKELTYTTASAGSYGDANVAAYLPAYTGSFGTNSMSNIAIGQGAANNGSFSGSTPVIAIGLNAGAVSQGNYGIALGAYAGQTQSQGAIAIGGFAARNNTQGQSSIAIGTNAAQAGQGNFSIAIGQSAGYLSSYGNSIILNADINSLDSYTSGFFVKPIRNDATNTAQVVYYNTSTNELTYNAAGSSGSYGNSNVAAYLASNTDPTISNLNANAAVQAVAINTLNANVGTLYLGNISTNANLGAFETYANAQIGTINANLGTLYLGNIATNANLGAYQTYANTVIQTINANLGAFETYANVTFSTVANAASQQTQIDTNTTGLATLNANVGAFETYANLTFGTSNYSNVNVAAYLTTATISTTGNVTAANLITAGNVYGSYIIGDGSLLTNLPTQTGTYSNANVASYMPVYGGNILAGNVNIPYTSGTRNRGPLAVGGNISQYDTGVIASFIGNEPTYLYTSLQNSNSGATAYSSYALNDDTHTYYGELGINSSTYDYAAAGYPNNAFSKPYATFLQSTGANLAIGTYGNFGISFLVNGQTNTADALTIANDGNVTVPGNVNIVNTITTGNVKSTNGYFWANGTAYSTGSGGTSFTGNLAGNILYDSVNQRFFANAYPLSTPDASRYSSIPASTINPVPVYTNGVLQPQGASSQNVSGQVFGGVLSANIALQSAYGTGGAKNNTAFLQYVQVVPTTANTMNANDRIRAVNNVVDINLNGKTWGTMNSTTNQGAVFAIGQLGQAQVLGSGSISNIIGMSGGINVFPDPNGTANVQYSSGIHSTINIQSNVTNAAANVVYARLYSGAITGFTSNLTIQNAVGLHTYSGWAGSGAVGAANNPILGRYAILNEDANTTIQTAGNIVFASGSGKALVFGDGTSQTTAATAFTGNLAGSILYDGVNERWFGNAYPLSTPDSTRYQNGFSDFIVNAPVYTNGAVQYPSITGSASRGGTTVGAIRSANIAIQSAYGIGGVKQVVNTFDYMQILGVTANSMNNNDRVRGFLAQLDVNPTGYTWGATGTGSQGATNLAGAGTITQLIGSGTVGHMIGVSGGVNVIPAPNTQANLLYGTGSFSVVTLAANATVTGQGNIGYARLFAGALAGFSSNLTVQNAVGLHTYSGWAGTGAVGAANNPIVGRYAILNEDANTTIQTNGNLVMSTNGVLNPRAIQETVYALGSTGGTLSFTYNNGTVQTLTATSNLTISNSSFTNLYPGGTITIIITQDGTGGRTLTSSGIKWSGGNYSLSTAAGAIDTATIFYDGTNYLATLVKGYT